MTSSSTTAEEKKTFGSVMKDNLHRQAMGRQRAVAAAGGPASAVPGVTGQAPLGPQPNIWSHRLLPAT